MFRLCLAFQLRQTLKRTSTLLYFLIFFALTFALAIAAGGAFEGFTYSLGLSSKLALNSPIGIHRIISYISTLSFLIIAPIFGRSIGNDFESGTHQILFATPIGKSTYFFSRYLSSTISVLTISLSFALAIWLATKMPFVDATLVGKNQLRSYLAPYLSTILPNTLIFGAIFMAVVAKTKKMAPIYVASIALYTGMMISSGIRSDLDNKLLVSLLDASGLEAALQVIRYWSVDQQSNQVIPVIGHLLYNRLLWGSIGAGFLAFAYALFNPFSLPKKKEKQKTTYTAPKTSLSSSKLSPGSWKVFWQLSFSEVRQAFSNVYFLVILLCAVLYLFSTASFVGRIFGTATLPVTYQTLETVGSSFAIFMLILTTFYAGELIWKDKTLRVSGLIDSKPVSNTFLYLSKLLALVWIQVFLLFVVLTACVLIQISKGYTHFEWSIYFTRLFVFTLPSLTLTCIFTLFAQTLAPNKYVGHGIVILYFTLFKWVPALGLDHSLFLIGKLPIAFYSDMNGFGPIRLPFTLITLYWGLFHFALALATILLWQRGLPLRFRARALEAKSRTKRPHKALLTTSLSLWIGLGGIIFYNTNILNTYTTKTEAQRQKVAYEKNYKAFKNTPHPDLTSVNVHVDLFPEQQAMKASGLFLYKNKGESPVEEILLTVSNDSKVVELEWNKPAHLTKHDEKLGIRLYNLNTPLSPGDELELKFIVHATSKGFQNKGQFSTTIVENGTFFHGNQYFPFLGYQPNIELAGEKNRRKYGLPEKPRMAAVDDWDALHHHYISNQGSWIDFETTISTSPDQIALAPGHLEKEWTDGDRRYFHYKAERPILPIYAFLSGRYTVARDQWNDVEIQVLHHPTHTRNIARMIDGVKKSLDYYTTNFSPYPFRDIRIVEFPRYQVFAEALPTIIPYSEGIGFIAKVDPNNPKDVDYPFYVTAHEMAHQWWAHQVIGGAVQGATMLSESLAQYSALMVMEKEVGAAQMQKFLKYELDRYLVGRSIESKAELPLMLNEGQQYIHYNKGSLAFYALKDYLGEEKVNEVLRSYIADVAYQEPPFTRAIDLVYRFKEAVSSHHQYLIEDLFETITFYDNQTESLTYHQTESGTYEVEITARSKKFRADENGVEQEVALDDWIDVGLFDKEDQLIYLEKHQVGAGTNTFQVTVDTEPAKGGLDPLNKLIDKVSDGHIKKAIKRKQD